MTIMTINCLKKPRTRWERTKWWSPPLHYQMEITATTYLEPIDQSLDVLFIRDITLISRSSCDTSTTPSTTPSTLPTHKPTSQPISQPRTKYQNLKSRIRSISLLDIITRAAGSRSVFLLTLLILAIWVILGIVLGTTQVWQIIMQNASSIQCYVSDTLLMRQQQNSCCEILSEIGELRSRNRSLSRMLKQLSPSQREALRSSLEKENLTPIERATDISSPQNLFDKICDLVATAVGSLPSVLIYTIGIFIWLGLGALYNFSNLWQLYINTAVAAELTFTSMFLQNVRRRHTDSLNLTLFAIKNLDIVLERHLRILTADTESHLSFSIPHPETNLKERFIDCYAYVVGSGVGVAFSMVVLGVWIALGHLLSWNSNWWLIIGTYTGLVGFVDGFVLRNVYFRQTCLLNEHLESLSQADSDLFSLLNLPLPVSSTDGVEREREKSWSSRISNWTITICSLPQVVLGSLATVVALLAVATGLRWSETGQLICNTPTMIVEGLLLLVLFQAHNLSMVRRWEQFGDVEGRREGLRRGLVGMDGEGEGEKGASVVTLVVEVKD